MKNYKNLVTRNKEIADRILKSMYLLDILEQLNDGEIKSDILINTIKKHLRCAFREIETCRRMVSIGE